MDIEFPDQSWVVGERIGAGAFGEVRVVRAKDGAQAVAKFVPNEPEVQRESLVAEALKAAKLEHVISIIDSGLVGDHFVIVMPQAEMSLRDYLNQYPGPVPLKDALAILSDIATALGEIKDAGIVHRDLKPENVLLWDGRWVLCDFGIARFDETATATVTHKRKNTPQYAAPEQWRQERATSATDVYAFGVIAYEVLAGARPFADPDIAGLREKHLHEQPEPLAGGTTQLRWTVEMCLEKTPEARPHPKQILTQLGKAAAPPAGTGAQKLIDVNYSVARERAAASAAQARLETEKEHREALFRAAQSSFAYIAATLRDALEATAPMTHFDVLETGVKRLVRREGSLGRPKALSFEAILGGGVLRLREPTSCEFPDAPFDGVAYASIGVIQNHSKGEYAGRSHSLWYCDPHVAGEFGWHELAFMNISPRKNDHGFSAFGTVAPFSAVPDEVREVFERTFSGVQLAWPLEMLDTLDLGDFTDRWLGWFAGASTTSLGHPSRMPEKPIEHPAFRRS